MCGLQKEFGDRLANMIAPSVTSDKIQAALVRCFAEISGAVAAAPGSANFHHQVLAQVGEHLCKCGEQVSANFR